MGYYGEYTLHAWIGLFWGISYTCVILVRGERARPAQKRESWRGQEAYSPGLSPALTAWEHSSHCSELQASCKSTLFDSCFASHTLLKRPNILRPQTQVISVFKATDDAARAKLTITVLYGIFPCVAYGIAASMLRVWWMKRPLDKLREAFDNSADLKELRGVYRFKDSVQVGACFRRPRLGGFSRWFWGFLGVEALDSLPRIAEHAAHAIATALHNAQKMAGANAGARDAQMGRRRRA